MLNAAKDLSNTMADLYEQPDNRAAIRKSRQRCIEIKNTRASLAGVGHRYPTADFVPPRERHAEKALKLGPMN